MEHTQVIYRKYRPKEFDEIVGQEHIVVPIRNAIRMQRIAHAYLFSGPRGVGKTTTARLIAKSINCAGEDKPCNKCPPCFEFNAGSAINMIEIDAASNRGIDEIRELRDAVRFVPSQGTHKVYIIDECHMLTKDAFGALLKTLEEPPAHAIFILATTELEKVPATIVSRTQHYSFRRPSITDIVTRLTRIVKEEGGTLAPDAAQIIALAAEGSLRDAESILGQILAIETKDISKARVEETLGLPPREAASRLFELIANRDAAGALAHVQTIADAGHDLPYLAKLLVRYFRAALFLRLNSDLARYVSPEFLAEEFELIKTHVAALDPQRVRVCIDIANSNIRDLRHAPIAQLPLELTVVETVAALDPKPAQA